MLFSPLEIKTNSTEYKHYLLQEKIKSWTMQLYQEYKNICFNHGVNLATPLITIEDIHGCLGYWEPTKRKISIALELILQQSWYVVEAILRHEMAHQFVTDIFKSQAAHGDNFKTACELLGVPTEFRKAGINFSTNYKPWQEDIPAETEHKIIRKIEKLLQLADSGNEHESALAMQHAQKLIREYNIEKFILQQQSTYYSIIINHNKKRIESTQQKIVSILCSFYYVKAVLSSQYNANLEQEFKVIELMGSRENVLMAEYVYYFLYKKIDLLWQAYRQKNACSNSYRNSYEIGLLVGFYNKLNSQNTKEDDSKQGTKENIKIGKELIKYEENKLEEYQSMRFPKLVSRKSGRINLYSDTYQQGKSDGKNITVQKGVGSNKSTIQLK